MDPTQLPLLPIHAEIPRAPRTAPLPRALLALTVLALTTLAGCSGSPTTPPRPQSGLTFTPAASPAPPNSVTLQRVGSATSSPMSIDVVATGVSDVAAVYFDLVFDPAVLSYQSATAGDFFAAAGTTDFHAELDMTSGTNFGRLLVSASVLGGASVTGSGKVATIVLARAAAGTTAVAFENVGALRPSGGGVVGLAFHGGTATAR